MSSTFGSRIRRGLAAALTVATVGVVFVHLDGGSIGASNVRDSSTSPSREPDAAPTTAAVRPVLERQSSEIVVDAGPVAPQLVRATTDGAGDIRTVPAVDFETPLDVALFGDSLANESKDLFTFAFTDVADRVDVDTYTFGGTATCDWLDEIEAATATGDLDVVVLEFSGNALTKCMQAADGSPLDTSAYLARYEEATRAAIALASGAGAHTYLALSPISRDEGADSSAAALRDLYRSIAAERDDVHVVDAGQAVLADGVYTDRLPCLRFEDEALGCTDGTISVRKPDGAHFCPTEKPAVNGVVGSCPLWSSGAFRFATAMATPIIELVSDAT